MDQERFGGTQREGFPFTSSFLWELGKKRQEKRELTKTCNSSWLTKQNLYNQLSHEVYGRRRLKHPVKNGLTGHAIYVVNLKDVNECVVCGEQN